MLKKISLTCLLSLLVSGNVFGQLISLEFPVAAGKGINLFYFSGMRVDTLTVRLDTTGKGIFELPQKDYRGIIVLEENELGFAELLLAEPFLEVNVRADVLNIETAETNNSKENAYLKRIFVEQSQRMRQLAWLQHGEVFHADLDTVLVAKLIIEKIQTQQALEHAKNENSRSPLFAARYYEAMDFMNRLFEAEQTAYSQNFLAVKAEMEEAGMIPVIYRSGNMWHQMHNLYISLFNRVQGVAYPRQLYAESIINTLSHLKKPYYEGYLAGSIFETERFGWLEARDSILANVVIKNPHFVTNIPSLQLSLNSFMMRNKGIAPKIVGLSESKNYTRTVLAFHDSNCSVCLNEMNTLVSRYEHFKKNNVRVVSIAADKNKEHFEAEVSNFLWADILCDFQGFEGVNFTTFGVVATPTFFIIAKNDKIEGEFDNANDLISKLLEFY